MSMILRNIKKSNIQQEPFSNLKVLVFKILFTIKIIL